MSEGAAQKFDVIELHIRGGITLIDKADYEAVKDIPWMAAKSNASAYLRYAVTTMKIGGVRRRVPMHRLLLGLDTLSQVDHKNGDGLDNRRCNLRLCTPSQNAMNRRRGGASRFKGVSWHAEMGKWSAGIKIAGKTVHLGLHTTEEAAAAAYDAKAAEAFGEFAKLNFGRVDLLAADRATAARFAQMSWEDLRRMADPEEDIHPLNLRFALAEACRRALEGSPE